MTRFASLSLLTFSLGFFFLVDRIVYNEIDQEHSFECRVLKFQCRHGISKSKITSDATASTTYYLGVLAGHFRTAIQHFAILAKVRREIFIRDNNVAFYRLRPRFCPI